MQLHSWIKGGSETFCGEEQVDSGGFSHFGEGLGLIWCMQLLSDLVILHLLTSSISTAEYCKVWFVECITFKMIVLLECFVYKGLCS